MTGRPVIPMQTGELHQLLRLDLFKKHHPRITVHHCDGYWQAVIPPGAIPADNSTQVITRYKLCDLLDELAARTGSAVADGTDG